MIAKTDYFGTREIYYKENENIYFNNLTKSITETGFSDYSKEGICSFFTFRYPILANTMFQGYKKLDNGTSYINNSTSYYWKPTFENNSVPFDDALLMCENLLIESLNELIQYKKRIGITLSGGLDSSLILALCKKHFPNKEFYTYSCGFYGDDEFEYSRLVAKQFSDKHYEVVLNKDDFIGNNSILSSLIKQKCSPLHPNELGLAKIELQAKLDLCDIVLSGEGADDIFGGYGKNLRMYLNYSGTTDNFYKYILDEYRYFSIDKIKKLIKPKYLINDLDLLESVFQEDECPDNIENQMFYFIQRIHTPGLIQRGTNALKYSNFEPAFPFIYPKLVNFVNSLPFDYKVHWNTDVATTNLKCLSYRDISEVYDTPKFILKKLAEKHLPHSIIYRKKYGFPVPFEKWLNTLEHYSLDKEVFTSNDISYFSGWEKFMIINLNTFITIFNKYKS